jgi:hypothetical protein
MRTHAFFFFVANAVVLSRIFHDHWSMCWQPLKKQINSFVLWKCNMGIKGILRKKLGRYTNCKHCIAVDLILKHYQKGMMLVRVRYIIYSTNMIRPRDVTWRGFGHCVVCSSIYRFWLPLWYLQTLLKHIFDDLVVLNKNLLAYAVSTRV